MQVGMRYFHLNRNKYFCPIINLDKIWTLVGEEVRAGRGGRLKRGVAEAAVGRLLCSTAGVEFGTSSWGFEYPAMKRVGC